MTDTYLFWKTAHILSATILLGTGIGIAFFCWFGYRAAVRSDEIATLRTILRLTVIADACLTAPAVAFQAISGIVLINLIGWSQTSHWAIAVWALFTVVGACWLPVVIIQIWLKREAENAVSMTALPARFHRVFAWWVGLGVPAFCAVVVIFYVMVAKPFPVTGI